MDPIEITFMSVLKLSKLGAPPFKEVVGHPQGVLGLLKVSKCVVPSPLVSHGAASTSCRHAAQFVLLTKALYQVPYLLLPVVAGFPRVPGLSLKN